MRRWIGLAFVVGCGGDDITPDGLVADDPAADPADTRPTWHRDVRPIFDRQCTSCHRPGGPAPFALTHDDAEWADGAPSWAPAAAASIAAGTMPPWKPDPACTPLDGARVLTAEEKATVATWAAAAFPVGDPADYTGPGAPPPVGPPDLELTMPEPFIPDTTEPDDYQCFVLDYDASVERWMAGFDVHAQHPEMVHHVILYQLGADRAEDVAAWDAADPQPGYGCLFDAGTWESMFLAGWAPGQQPLRFGDGIARRIPAGSKLVMQVHYNTLVLGGAPPAADQSGIGLWMLPEGEEPDRELISIPFPVDLYLPAGAPEVVAEATITLSDLLGGIPEELITLFGGLVSNVGVFPHMHQLGTKIELSRVAEDGTETCMFSIDDWDFAWQQSYFFTEEHWYTPSIDDTIRLRCTYDNSAANQPVFNGVQQEPRDVWWGEGTTDEMCLMFFETLIPAGLFSFDDL